MKMPLPIRVLNRLLSPLGICVITHRCLMETVTEAVRSGINGR